MSSMSQEFDNVTSGFQLNINSESEEFWC